jgi:putative transcription antitermination factor YqgF
MSIGSLNEPETSQILAIDYGRSKVGLAMGEMAVKIAFAYKTLPNDEKFWEILTAIIAKEEIKKVIIGRPGHNNFKDSLEAREIKKLGERIKTELNLPVAYQEEMFTTRMARNNLKEKGMKNLEHYDDQESARIILESWFAKK